MELHVGRIVATHPESGSVDIILPMDGRRLVNVRVASSSASSSSGSWNIPSPELGRYSKDVAHAQLGTLEMQCIVGFTEGGPVCMGFLFPQVSQMMFKDKNRSINRHPSGVYTTIDGNGNFEFVHPSGTFIRIGGSKEHDDLSGKGQDGNWGIASTEPCFISISQGSASVVIDPAGNIEIKNSGNIDIKSSGDMDIDVGGSFKCKSGGNMSFKAPRIDMN